jgi:predicted glycosyltransferase
MFFVTSSEGDGRLHEACFPTFKIPSLQSVAADDREAIGYPDLAAECISHILQTMAPDLLVIDGAPTIALRAVDERQEHDLSRLNCRVAYVYGLVRQESFVLYKMNFHKIDRVIIPEIDSHDPQLASVLPSGSIFVGTIIDIPDECASNQLEARCRLGINPNLYTVYVSTGGGGHRDAQQQIDSICEVICQMSGIQAVVGAGPLFRGRMVRAPNVHWYITNAGYDLMLASDVAVSAAGANSFNELMYLGLPTIFVPLATGADDQLGRAKRAEQAGAARLLLMEEIDHALRPILEEWRSETARSPVAHSARCLVKVNGALQAASGLLEMLQAEVDYPCEI